MPNLQVSFLKISNLMNYDRFDRLNFDIFAICDKLIYIFGVFFGGTDRENIAKYHLLPDRGTV